MAKSRFNSIVDKMLDDDFIDHPTELTEDELFFLQQNPKLLSKISDSSFIRKKYIFRLFAISITLAAIAKSFEYSQWFVDYNILNNLLTEVLFAIAMEMLGATIIAYFLEITLERRVQKNQKIVEQIIERAKESVSKDVKE